MNTPPKCAECRWVIPFLRPVCEAPQLATMLDGPPGRVPRITDCEGVRDFKHACGYAGQWFVQKGAHDGR